MPTEDRFGCQTTCTASKGCYLPHPPSAFIIITHPKSRYSFYCPTEGGRLSRPGHCSKGEQPMPKAVYRSDWCDKHNFPWLGLNLGGFEPGSFYTAVRHITHHWTTVTCCIGYTAILALKLDIQQSVSLHLSVLGTINFSGERLGC